MSDYTNFDLLLYVATEKYCDEIVREVKATPADETISKRERRRFQRILRKYGTATYRWTPWRIAVAAVLLCMSISFTACMFVPAIRSAIKQVFVEWYQEYISVDFKNPDETESLETETLAPPPETIQRKAYVANLPEGYTSEVEFDFQTYYCVNYYYENNYSFYLSQNIIQKDKVWFDGEGKTVEYIILHQCEAVVMVNTESSTISVIWQDNQYQYAIEGHFESKDAAVAMAQKVVVE